MAQVLKEQGQLMLRKVPEKIKESFNNMASDFVAVGSKVKVLWTEKELKAQRLGWLVRRRNTMARRGHGHSRHSLL